MKGMGRKLGILLLTAAVLALGSGTGLATDWTFTDLSLQGDIIGDSFAGEINNNGDIVGVAEFAGYDYHRHTTLWSGGVATDLGSIVYSSGAGGINDAGVIVGYTDTPLNRKAAIFSTSAPPVVIHPDVAYSINSFSLASSINNAGQMSGYADTDLLGQVPILWSDPETYTILDAGTTGMGYAKDLNNLGQVAGFIYVPFVEQPTGYLTYKPHAAFWDVDGTLTHIGTFEGTRGMAKDLNDLGQVLVNVIGTTVVDGDHVADEWSLVWQDGEVGERLPGLGATRTEANAINNNGLIVGSAYTADGEQHAVIWQDGEIIDLNDLVSGTGMVLTTANDINDQGQIVGYGTVVDYVNEHGMVYDHYSAFLLTPNLTPTPVPASVLLFGSGLAGLVLFRRRTQA